ncbi:MAG: type III-B CRISPR-associated protein Cas10/Cmr2 [Acidipropionibacterium sp.]|jgi:CRISPR-associated protein Cmr2|nr:type III-B CRISPR-associated protein Cas10/Cmr2 [Acidipropionibacterium sp.]
MAKGSDRMMYLISISIGPVQEFIAAARKTQDLAAGSKLLGKIVEAAARTFPDPPQYGVFGPGRVFPTRVDGGGANKILAIVDEDPAAAAERARTAAVEALRRIWADQKLMLGKQWLLIDVERAEAQIDAFLEVYGAWVPVDEDSYPEMRKKVEALLAGRKDLRDFAPAPGNDQRVAKSALDPSRASVVSGRGELASPEKLRAHPLWLRSSELLDGISLLKRLYGRGLADVVLSTRDLAQRSKEPEQMPRGEDDFEPEFPYYAILVADGDHMGERIGTFNTPEDHREFSQRLDSFASKAAECIADQNGQSIYTGGDDVMALLPVSTAVECANKLSDLFLSAVAPEGGEKATISAGLAIVHYREPLSAGLARARTAERLAKESGRERIAVALDKRGGQPLVVTEEWPVKRLVEWPGRFASGELAGRLPYKLRTLSEEWPNTPKGASSSETKQNADALSAEVLRIIKRSQAATGTSAQTVLDGFTIGGPQDLGNLVNLLIVARFLGGALLA